MKKHFILRAAALAACLAVAIPHIFANSFRSEALVLEDYNYDFDDNVSEELKRAISKRIFEDDFDNLGIDLSDLDIPDSEQNRTAVETLIRYGFPRRNSNDDCGYYKFGWTYQFIDSNIRAIMECQAAADELLLGIAGNDSYTDAQKAYLIQERLLDRCEVYCYGESPAEYEEDVYCVYGALINGYAVCDGYSRAFMYLCRRAGIECYYDSAKHKYDPDKAGHAWNVIYLDGEDGVRRPYYVDTKWADEDDDRERYFLTSYNSFRFEHSNYDAARLEGSDRNMPPEEYKAALPGASAPRVTMAYSSSGNIDIYVASEYYSVLVYFGRSEDPAESDFVPMTSVFPDRFVYSVNADGKGTYYAAAKDINGTSAVSKLERTEDYYIGEYDQVHITSVDPNAKTHPWYYEDYANVFIIEDGITVIPDNAFAGKDRINTVLLPEGIEKIGTYAFFYCSLNWDLALPQSVKSIGDCAYKCCAYMRGMDLPAGVDVINKSVFEECVSLKKVDLPENLKAISKDAFKNCRALESVTFRSIPDSVDEDAFAGCDSLEYVSLVSEAGFTLTIPVK